MKIIYTKNGCDEELSDHNTNTDETNITKNRIKALFSSTMSDIEIENSFAVFGDWKTLEWGRLIANFFIAMLITLFLGVTIEPYILPEYHSLLYSGLYLLSYLLLTAFFIAGNWYMEKRAISDYNNSTLRINSEIEADKNGERFIVFYSDSNTESHKIAPLSEFNYNRFKRFYYEDNEDDHTIEAQEIITGIEYGRIIIDALREKATKIFVEDINIENTLIINI